MYSQARTYRPTLSLSYLALFIVFSTQAAFAEALSTIRTFDKGVLDVGVGVSYLSTNRNYSNSGSQFALSGNNNYELIQTPIRSRYGLFENWSISAGAMISTATSKDNTASRKNSSLTDAELGVDWLFYQGFADVWVESQLIYPFEKITTTQDTAINGEGVMQVKTSLGFSKEMASFFLYGSTGFNWRQSGRASLVLGQIGASYLFSNFMVGLETNGYVPANDDADRSSETARYSLIQKVNAGSYRFYSVNPAYGEAKIWAEFPVMGLDVGTYASLPYYGQNISYGPLFGINVSMSFDFGSGVNSAPAKSKKPAPAFGETPLSTQKKVKEFKESTDDGVDQKLFVPTPNDVIDSEESNTVSEEAPADAELAERAERVSRKKFKKNPSKKEIKNQLDDVEMTIKLKSNKK
jgi:hypothetical protein